MSPGADGKKMGRRIMFPDFRMSDCSKICKQNENVYTSRKSPYCCDATSVVSNASSCGLS
jgi:hypothetical protein